MKILSIAALAAVGFTGIALAAPETTPEKPAVCQVNHQQQAAAEGNSTIRLAASEATEFRDDTSKSHTQFAATEGGANKLAAAGSSGKVAPCPIQ